MDADHLDIYGEHTSLVHSFKKFANQVSDILIVATGAQQPTVDKYIIQNNKPLLILDLSIPKKSNAK